MTRRGSTVSNAMLFEARRLSDKPDGIALDGSEVRVLCGLSRGSLSVFTLPAGKVARAVAHRTIEEVWYVIAGTGQMWRRLGDQESVDAMDPGVSLGIPTGTHFQFRCDGEDPLTIVAAVMPPWPGDEEVYEVQGRWVATV